MPLKRTVMPMLATLDDWASLVQAANTVVFGADAWHGANTDVPGMIAVLRSAAALRQPAPPPWILGAGATAGSALAALAELGSEEVVVAARRTAAAAALEPLADRLGVSLVVRPWSDVSDVADAWAAPVVVATTPAGATDPLAAAGPGAGPVGGVLFDVVYAPWPTRFAAAWQAAGGEVVGGLELLVAQAVEQVELMTGRRPASETLRAAGYAALA
jgi:shikimate dehydrogenase